MWRSLFPSSPPTRRPWEPTRGKLPLWGISPYLSRHSNILVLRSLSTSQRSLLPLSHRPSLSCAFHRNPPATTPDLIKMPRAHLNASVDTPNVDMLVDLGHPLLNRVFDGFVKVGGVGALHAASQDTYRFLLQEETNKKSLEKTVQRMGKEAVQWGLVAGVYTGMTYGMQEARGVHDWKNALLGGALTGAALSLTEPNPRSDRIVRGAITGGAIATAAEFLRNLT